MTSRYIFFNELSKNFQDSPHNLWDYPCRSNFTLFVDVCWLQNIQQDLFRSCKGRSLNTKICFGFSLIFIGNNIFPLSIPKKSKTSRADSATFRICLDYKRFMLDILWYFDPTPRVGLGSCCNTPHQPHHPQTFPRNMIIKTGHLSYLSTIS